MLHDHETYIILLQPSDENPTVVKNNMIYYLTFPQPSDFHPTDVEESSIMYVI